MNAFTNLGVMGLSFTFVAVVVWHLWQQTNQNRKDSDEQRQQRRRG